MKGDTREREADARRPAIHGAPEFTTEWLAGVDPAWIP